MSRKASVAILGNGRIGQAVAWYLARDRRIARVEFVQPGQALGPRPGCSRFDLLVGALAGEIGPQCLEAALRWKLDLIDISDVDPPGYFKRQKEIAAAGITVIPGCGFSPGLVNAILGREFARRKGIRDVEVKAGSLSRKEFYYPFLWCFEDIVLEHTIGSWQIVGGARKKFPVFDGYQPEKFFGIEAESYYCASGFENLLKKIKPRSFVVRVVRPKGFRQFFGYLRSYGLLDKDKLAATKAMLEAARRDNITLAQVVVRHAGGLSRWTMNSSSRASDTLNSMQKITASVPAVMAGLLVAGGIAGFSAGRKARLLFMDELAQDDAIFTALLAGIRAQGIRIHHD